VFIWQLLKNCSGYYDPVWPVCDFFEVWPGRVKLEINSRIFLFLFPTNKEERKHFLIFSFKKNYFYSYLLIFYICKKKNNYIETLRTQQTLWFDWHFAIYLNTIDFQHRLRSTCIDGEDFTHGTRDVKGHIYTTCVGNVVCLQMHI